MFRWWRRKAAVAVVEGSWQLKTDARLQESRDGQMLEYPGRVVVCPVGHERVIPTRFDRPVEALTCAACGRKYPLGTGQASS